MLAVCVLASCPKPDQGTCKDTADCADGQGCLNGQCLRACNTTSDCAGSRVACRDGLCRLAECGNGVIEAGETCDLNCASQCTAGSACVNAVLTGSPDTCNSTCTFSVVEACTTGDGCCPSNCNQSNDGDCPNPTQCGDAIRQPPETCDGDCPTSCNDGVACTQDLLTGSAANCTATCTQSAITACVNDDGCCPTVCSSASDNDCVPTPMLCGNDTVDTGETCDGNCPTSCDDGMACTQDSLTGSVNNCTAACTYTAITGCTPDDGCCPNGCLPATDNDCELCGNGTVDTGETCDGNCPTSCNDNDPCTTDVLSGSACTTTCTYTPIAGCGVTAQPMFHSDCPDGQVLNTGRTACVGIEQANLGGGKLWWVDPANGNNSNNGTRALPVRDIEMLLEQPQAFTPVPQVGDDIVVVGPGMVRTNEIHLAATWRGAPANRTYLVEYSVNNEFIFDGATRDLNGGWQLYSGNIYRKAWPWMAQFIGPDHPAIMPYDTWGGSHRRRETIIQDETRMLLDQSTLADLDRAGEFFIDGWPDIQGAWAYAWFYDNVDPNGHSIRSTATADLAHFLPHHDGNATPCGTPATDNHLTIIGFAWRNTATLNINGGGVCMTAHMVLEDGEIYNHAQSGLSVRGPDTTAATGVVLRHMHAHHNGNGGLNGRSLDGALVEHNLVEYNTLRDVFWQEGQENNASAGGGKFLKTVNSTFRFNTYQHNGGETGLWLDFQNDGNRIERNRFIDNYVSGMMLEVGSDNNVVINNLFADTRWRNKTPPNGTIGSGSMWIFSSRDNLVAYNTFIDGQATGVSIQEDSRFVWSSESVDNAIFNNTFINTPTGTSNAGPNFTFTLYYFYHPENAQTTLSGGNYFDAAAPSPNGLFALVNPDGSTVRTSALSALTAWNGDNTSFIGQSGVSYVVNPADSQLGWIPAASSGLAGKAVPIPAGYAITDADITEDFFGNPRPASLAQRHVGAAEGGPAMVTPVTVSLPGRIEAEDYRTGGEGIGYHDNTPGNSSGGCRSDDVDIKDVGGGNCVVGFFDQGEWLAFNVNVTTAGNHVLQFNVARGATGASSLHVELNGTDVTGPVTVPSTGAWETFATVQTPSIALSAGAVELRVVNDGGFFDLDWLQTL